MKIKFNLLKKRSEESILEKGKVILYLGSSVKIVKRVKTEYNPTGKMKYNTFQSFVGVTESGQRIYIQESDVACPVRLTKTIHHHAPGLSY